MKKFLVILILLLSIFVIANSVSAASESKIVFNVEHDELMTSITHILLVGLSDKIYKMTDGQIKLEIFPSCSSSGGNIKTMIENIKMGLLDAGLVSEGVFSLYDERLAVITLPFMFKNIQELEKISRNSPEIKEIYKSFEDKYGLTVVDVWPRALRQFVNNKKKIETIEDLKGLRIRLGESRMMQIV